MVNLSEEIIEWRAAQWAQGFWEVPENLDTSGFDFSWRPSPYDRPYVHQFGTQWQRTGGPRFIIPNAEGVKYQNHQTAIKLPEPQRFRILIDHNVEFDFSWHPDDTDPPMKYIFGNQLYSPETAPTIEYINSESTVTNFVQSPVAHVKSKTENWFIFAKIDTSRFNFDWFPNPYDPARIYVWGNQYCTGDQNPTVEYRVPGATERICMADQVAHLANDPQCWKVNARIDTDLFDFSWAPHPHDPPYIYTWGNQFLTGEQMPTVEYHAPGATERKYITDQVSQLINDPECWVTHAEINLNTFDYEWVPHPWDPPYVYVWGNEYLSGEQMPTVEYHVPGATERKYMTDQQPRLKNNRGNWVIQYKIQREKFDWDWAPHPWDPPYIYTWGHKWNPVEIDPAVEYRVPGATERKYMPELVHLSPTEENWRVLVAGAEFDQTWKPDPTSPAYIYVWGNQWHDAITEPTIEYAVPGATERKYMTDRAAHVPATTEHWRTLVQGAQFDYSWRPDPYSPAYIYVWGNQWHDAITEPTIEYHVPGATERKYMTDTIARVPETTENWKIIIPGGDFDYSWRPDPHSPAYIYVWGNQWHDAATEPTIEYHTPGATERKYIHDHVVQLPPTDTDWKIVIPGARIDFSWRPDPHSPAYIYVWGHKWNPVELDPAVEYHVPGATERKYMHDTLAILPQDMTNWRVLITGATLDWTWRPDPTSPPYIYVWGNKWNDAATEPTIEYVVPGATERKYMPEPAQLAPDHTHFQVRVPEASVDWTWRPNPHSTAYIYVWGNKWNPAEIEPTVEYHVPGATEHKYMAEPAQLVNDMTHWRILMEDAIMDFTWRPNPLEPAYIYAWGTKWHPVELGAAIEYHRPGATERKYMHDRVVDFSKASPCWRVLIPGSLFDDSWRPNPRDPAYIYVWGNQWHPATVEPTVEYHVPGATERKYMDNWVATAPVDMSRWTISDPRDIETFDFSWRPNPHSPAQIYQWQNNGPTYTVPGATDVVLMERDNKFVRRSIPRYTIKTTLEDLIAEHPEEVFWAVNPLIDYSDFDFDWTPDASNFKHINVFGNKLSRDTQTYYVNAPMYNLGHRYTNYVTQAELNQEQDLVLPQRIMLDMFYVEVVGHSVPGQFEALQQRFPNIQKMRYLNSWRDTVLRCTKRAQTRFVWILNSRTDYQNFGFDWYPADWQQNMVHVFGTQWNHWGNTYLVNSQTYENDVQYIEAIEHLRNINHVRGHTIPVTGCVNDIVYIDMGNSGGQLEQLRQISRNVSVIPYTGSYLSTLRDWLAANPALRFKRDYCVWITNSIADYVDFDWSWHSDPFQREQLHVFASQYKKYKQKFGDTLFVNVSELFDLIDSLQSLEEYNKKVNYITHLHSGRQQHPVVSHTLGSQVQALDQIQPESWPYYELINTQAAPAPAPGYAPSVWGQKHETVMVTTTGASQIFVPGRAIHNIKTEIYDYDLVEHAKNPVPSLPLDIVFISNGEPIAESNYEHLAECLQRASVPNRIVRVQNVDGRVASQHAAARAASTGWYFLVNGKVRVRDNFDWSWQPDRLQQPKHYVFTVTNPVNGLEYGHQAIVANNRELTLNTVVRGLDFTLDSLHEVLEINCGVALYNTDPWTTWRTAFRESIKLRSNTDDVSRYRLKIWTTLHDGEHGEWSVRGARDGVEFWESVNGNLDELMQSYDWAWIREYYEGRYGK